ncbi:MAG TPA: hypothetical protein VFN87_09445 [Solirubrobacteraceae bacterium]|nr:hypothetical protein [Solirubrobacteraceae bacterium]
MNPLLFADWRRINRVFTRIMWGVAAIMICVVVLALASTGSHPRPAAAGARAAGAVGSGR